jgi:hypothetical protein
MDQSLDCGLGRNAPWDPSVLVIVGRQFSNAICRGVSLTTTGLG